MDFLKVVGLKINFGGLRALHNVGFEIQESEVIGVIGPNGSGKTTCFNAITGFLKPDNGTITYRGTNIVGLEPFEIAELGIIRTFQLTSVFPNLTCLENIVLGQYVKTKGNFFGAITRSKRYRKEEEELRVKAKEKLDFVGMSNRVDTLARNLPFGDERKLEIAIALASEPELLLLDEPAAGMSPDESGQLMKLIRSVHDMGITILLVEHNMRIVMGICDRIVVLNFGEIIAEGTPEEIGHNDEVASIYLGRRDEDA